MPHITVKETLALLKTLAEQGTARRFVGLQHDMEGLSAQLTAAANAPLGATPDVANTLSDLQLRAAEVQELGKQAEAGLGQLAGVFSKLGLESEPVLRSEREKVPLKLYIDAETGTVVEGKIAGILSGGQILNAVAALAEADGPVSQTELSRAVFGKEVKEPWLRRRMSILNGRAEKLGLEKVFDSPNRAGYVLGPEYEVLGRKRTFYPEPAPAHAEPLPSAPEPVAARGKKRRPDLAETLGTQQFFYGATVTKRTGVGQTALDLMEQLGVLKERSHFVRRGERDIRVYTPDAVALAEELAKFAKRKRQGRFTERLVRDAFGFPSEERPKNPYGENGPKTVDDGVEYFLLKTVAVCLPTLRKKAGEMLTGQDDAIEHRLEELKTALLEAPADIQAPEKRRLAAATAFDLIANRRPFNFLLNKRPGLALVGELIDQLRTMRPGLLREFPGAVVSPPTTVPHVDADGRVNGWHKQGPLGDIR